MHARHRSPANGYRSNSMGIGGVAAASRISPDAAGRGPGLYNPEFRGFNRGFGRGQSRPFQPPQPSPRKGGDVFIDAGRLATEYLVSKGLLPQNVFSGKWQNGSLKNQGASFQGFRSLDGDVLPESRISAPARLGDATGNDLGIGGKRRFPEENPADPRNYMRGRRIGSFKGYDSDLNREFGRSSSWSAKSVASTDKDGNDDAIYGNQEEEQGNKDGGSGEQKSQSGENASKTDISGDSEPLIEKKQLADDLESTDKSQSGENASKCSLTAKDLPSETVQESAEKTELMDIPSVDTGKAKDDSCDNAMEKQRAEVDLLIQQHAEDNPTSGSDLLKSCNFAKVPTRTRSSLATKASKTDPVPITEVKNTNDGGLSLGSGGPAKDLSFDGSSGDASSDQNQSLKDLDAVIGEENPKAEAEELDGSYALAKGICTRSKSFPERSFMKEQESGEGPPGFGRCSTMDTQRGEKRALQLDDNWEDSKKLREFSPTREAQGDRFWYLSTSTQKQQTKPEGSISPSVINNNKNLPDVTLAPNNVAEPIEFTEEKQLFPGSFKICDLNLMEVSEPNENHDVNPLMNFPPIPHGEKETLPIDVDLSMSNNYMIPDKFRTRGTDGKEVEVIDLENESVQDEKALANPDQKDETLFTGLENFTNNAPVNDIPDGQDGYGMMISELLESDLPNCSSVPPGINSLQNEMGLNNGEGMLGDDDSIYMSLGEIPISFLRVWEQQPTQDYDKPF